MKATTLQGMPKKARRLLVAIRDRRPYVLPRGVQAGSPQALAHVTALTRILGAAGLVVATEVDPDDPTKVLAVEITDKGRKAAEGL